MLKKFALMTGAVLVLSGCSACSNMDDEAVSPTASGLPTVKEGNYTYTSPSANARDTSAYAVESLNMVNFGYDSSALDAKARATLDRFAEGLKGKNYSSIIVEGHCDERGTREYNLALGDRRATSAKKYLVGLGLDANRITTISYGKERPLDTRHTPAAWSKNRRAMLVVK